MSVHKCQKSSQSNYIWESSVIKNPSPRIVIPSKKRSGSEQKNYSSKKFFPDNNIENSSPNEMISTFFCKSPQRPVTSLQKAVVVQQYEEAQISDNSTANFYKPTLDKYLEDDRTDYVVHTYARPRRLVAIKDKVTYNNEDKKIVLTPSTRLGISG